VDHVALTSFFRELFESVGLSRRRARLGLRPHRDVLLPIGIDAAYDRTLASFERTLGANISTTDRASHTIEAGFGLVNQARVRAKLESEGETQTRVRIEALYPAGVTPHARSDVVDALADALLL
jgi:hypothetical protein